MALETQLTVLIAEKTKARLDALRDAEGVNISQFIRLAIEERLAARYPAFAAPESQPAQ